MQQSVDAPDRTFTVEEFLAEYEGREGKFELVDGRVVEVSPERLLHSVVKATVAAAFGRAIEESGRALFVAIDGVAVKTAPYTSRIPDVLVGAWDGEADEAVIVERPVVAVEILSDATARTDTGMKVREYLAIPSLTDYLVVDAEAKLVTHHCRRMDGTIRTEFASEGALVLGAGLSVEVSAFWPRRP